LVDFAKQRASKLRLPLCSTRPLVQLRFYRFSGLFWPIFDSACGGNILFVDIAPTSGIENWPK
jgi:hypothetical protein